MSPDIPLGNPCTRSSTSLCDSPEYVINHSELPIVFTGSKHISTLLSTAKNCPCLKMVVSIDPLDATTKAGFNETASQLGIEVKEMRERESPPTDLSLTKTSDFLRVDVQSKLKDGRT